jgi:hypothetical protein
LSFLPVSFFFLVEIFFPAGCSERPIRRSLKAKDQVSPPYKATKKYSFVCIELQIEV